MISAQQTGTLCILILVVAGVFIAGCTDETGPAPTTEPTATPTATVMPAGEVSIGYVLWDSEIASTNVLKTVYEQAGYDVELKAVDAGPLYQALADGQVDMSVSSWMPTTHDAYWDTYGDDIDMVGTNLEGAKIGLVVPRYVKIDSIEELNNVTDQFDGKIIGIEPGAGIMAATERAIEEYGLDYTLVPSSSAAMAAQLTDAYENYEWIVVTGWTPHWKFVRFDLKYLDDPKGVYGGEEYIASLARQGFSEDNPEAYAILERFGWESSDMEEVMLAIEDGATPEDAAQAWVDANQDRVIYWINR
ncbi:glycine betaine ABC transporter substrate-binding protein [Methanogenium organophilum]|uniref:Glycine betaine ABC transporter substrate-binding protein n=1 Tax=Methanogenium organophilum TaxID=2199 RepID=A0A9X9S692_METOG|nr:glycine betaine ABC transporter substrate-binding protein [Methanogenium organophilum]WAI02477.1 glycine betaine ABC transporter substrate-binding protein [Methanogenium organophilum]